MADENQNRGVLFVNDRKGDNPKAPDRKGHIVIDGIKYWLSGWLGKSQKDGSTYLSLVATEDEAKPQPHQQQAKRDYQQPPAGNNNRSGDSRASTRRQQQEPDADEIPF